MIDEKEFREKYEEKLKDFGFKYAFSEDQGENIAIQYETEDYKDPEKWVVLLFRMNKETGKINEVYAFHNIKGRDIVESNYILFDKLFDALNASYEKGKGFSVKKFIHNHNLLKEVIKWKMKK